MPFNYSTLIAVCTIPFIVSSCVSGLETDASSASKASKSESVELVSKNDLQHSTIKQPITQQGQVTWHPCTHSQFSEWFTDTPLDNIKALQCATLDVPISATASGHQTKSPNLDTTNNQDTTNYLDNNYHQGSEQNSNRNHEATVITIAMTKLPTTGSSKNRIGTLINIAGGPGESMVGSIPAVSDANKKLSQHFDIISYAPRGIAPSTPVIKCTTEVSELDDAWSQSFADACWEQTPNDLLKVLGSSYAVTDIEAIRQAIDEPKINLLAYSYGTHIGTLYAEKYPEHLRAGVLDGLINLEHTAMQNSFNQHARMQQTFEDFIAFCKKNKGCYYEDTKTVKEAEAKTAQLFKYVEDNQIHDSQGNLIVPFDLTLTISTFLSMPSHWELLNSLLILMDAEEFDEVSDLITQLNDGMYNDAFSAISCANGALGKDKKDKYIENVRNIDAQSTWDNYRHFEDNELLDPCYFWPIAGSDIPHIPKLSAQAPPLLLVAQTADFNTPYSSALAMQKYLNATLITRDDNGHVVSLFGISDCVDNKVVDYLLDPVGFAKREDDNLMCD